MTQKDKRIEWKARYEAWKASGQSIAEWCRSQEIKDHQMYYWVQQFEHGNHTQETPVETQWLAVQVDDEPLPSSGRGPILLHFGAISVEVRPGANMSLLSDVVHVLQSRC
ncbi:IS66 family insertion sequence element accessory protein TnpA [Lentibacillus salicampi]|uniref:IS66 family insertion sequence element accessory protein TnpB n=1 Tax=Lentibacillus salicampi TaxID=175306 RepID=A0A4Y9A7D9_9BACI|nr:IS66 family insertion sequence element accessory protein TnpB [Lentibacillus salicampi]TFJ91365.1 IS66 family insertion sequence element accessory protein TnpB [Lentibacillus salicampi]